MALFGLFGNKETGAGDSNYDAEHPLLGIDNKLTYAECREIYLNWALGKRMAKALPSFAMSAPRIITFDKMPNECADRFNEIYKNYNLDNIVKKLAINTRIYGMSGLFIAHSEVPPNEPLKNKDLFRGRLNFNIQDPMNLAGINITQDPTSVDFMKITGCKINGKEVHPSRLCVVFNDMSFYLNYVPSTFNFASTSIYQNIQGIIHSWNRCVVALERTATKAGAIIYKGRDGSVLNNIAAKAAQKTLETIRSIQNDGIAQIEKDSDIEFFNLSGVGEIDSIISQLNQIILMALNDTPAAILLDKELAQGFGNGAEDMKAILMAVDSFRAEVLAPIYDFTDKYALELAFNLEFLRDLKSKYKSDFKQSEQELKELIISRFKPQWGNLYPETESESIDNQSKKLDNLAKLKDLGANIADIESILNNDDSLYQVNIRLDSAESSDDFESDDSENESIE